ncbi:MAG: glycosyltransferase family 4 protein [Acidobacteria bacterium]|nr:glycosyltransferase family 4 protein [Acidobacteriota bacterium]
MALLTYSLTWLHNTPTPNQMEFFQELGKEPRVKLRVLHCSSHFDTRPFSLGSPWLAERDLSFHHEVLRGFNLSKHRDLYVNPGIISAVSKRSKGEVWLVGGHTIPTVQMAMWVLNFHKVPWILVTEPPSMRSSFRDFVRDILLRPLRMGAKGAIVYGSRRRAQYFSRFFPENRIFVTPQYQNLSPLLAIQRDTGSFQEAKKSGIRYFYAGRLESFSGVDLLIRAFNRLALKYGDVELQILGDGSQKPFLERLVLGSIKSRVVFHGAVPRERVPRMFAGGDIFVHPNRGQGWGMVVNEALAAGMPVIASRAVGAAEELVLDGVNGWLLERPDDENGFLEKMEFFAASRACLREFISNARKTASRINLQSGVAEFLGILDRILQPI